MDASPDLLGPALVLLALGVAVTLGRVRIEHEPGDPPAPPRPPRRSTPPDGLSVLVGAHLVRWRRRSATAQVAELVRRGVLAPHPCDPACVVVVDPTGLDPVEHAFAAALVGVEPRAGTLAVLRADDARLASRVEDAQAAVNRHVVDAGLRRVVRPRPHRWVPRAVVGTLAVAAAVLAVQDPRAWFVVLGLGLAVLVEPWRQNRHPLSAVGAAGRDQVLGVQEWLRFADLAERPEADLAALHPWAVLLGALDEWRARGGVDDPALRALLAGLGGDRPERGRAHAQPGDAWGDRSTGGSAWPDDGATPPED
jgi:hypothetical protein